MVFIDNLAYSLFALSFAGFLMLYTAASIYLAYRNKRKDYSEQLKGARTVLVVLGAFLLVSGIWGQFAWPLPGSYNILFYDPMIAFGTVLLAFVLAIQYKARFEYVGFFALMAGIVAIIYGFQGYNIGLTEAPIALLALYVFYGVAGIFFYPVSLALDRYAQMQKGLGIWWTIAIVIFCLALLGGSVVAGYIGLEAVPAHLLNAP